MSETIVQKKVASLIQLELSEILSRQLTYVPGILLTVTVVRVVPDLSLAKVYISTLPDSKIEETVKALRENNWEVRYALGQRIRNKVRKIPELIFYVDDSFAEAERINKIMEDLEIPEADPDEAENQD
ncbi:MAG: 30S ribosome-binding factor RbfA [Bacteroidota bacterium]